MENITKVLLNKNRGWRGLAELKCYDQTNKLLHTMVFSFSSKVWDNLIYMKPGALLIQDDDYYYVLMIDEDDRSKLPIGHQRSVLIKNWVGKVTDVHKYKKNEWTKATGVDWSTINNFLKNRNNHTTSDWNCIGVRVVPEI